MVKSTEGVLSAVPQLQTEEKHSAALSQLHWPVHHCRLNTLNKRHIEKTFVWPGKPFKLKSF